MFYGGLHEVHPCRLRQNVLYNMDILITRKLCIIKSSQSDNFNIFVVAHDRVTITCDVNSGQITKYAQFNRMLYKSNSKTSASAFSHMRI